MPTARSSADRWRAAAEWQAAVVDLWHLLWFRRRTTPRAAVVLAAAVIGLLTAAAVVTPAWWPDRPAATVDRVGELLPAYLLAIAAVSVGGAVAAGGGREVLARDAATVHPVGPFTDHLGALVLAPLSAAWLLQAWCLVGVTAWVTGPDAVALAGRELVALAWICCATAGGQVVGWLLEWLRRGPRGAAVVRTLGALALAAGVAVGASSDVRRPALAGPVRWTADALRGGSPGLAVLAVLVATSVALVLGGGYAARLAARRPAREEAHLESRSYSARGPARSDLAALVRTDRGSVWRSVPVRRGIVFLTLAPAAVALARPLSWDTLVVLPGLVVSGCVLLFGVNVWALDGRGLLWRETLPVSPVVPLLARTWVLGELLLGAGALTLALAAVRADRPTAGHVVAAATALLVVTGQALSGGLRWSQRAPRPVDYRSARATPAPPLTMVGYSVRLALATTSTSMVLGALAGVGRTDLVLAVGAVLVAWSAARVVRVGRRWRDPVQRAALVATVAA